MLRTWDQFSDNLIYHLVKNELAPFDNAEKAGTPFEYEHRSIQKTGKPATPSWKTPIDISRGLFQDEGVAGFPVFLIERCSRFSQHCRTAHTRS